MTQLARVEPSPPAMLQPIASTTYSLDDISQLAQKVATSRLFPGIENEASAFTLMMLCQSENLHPMQAVRRFHIIKGRPAMRADAIQAEFLHRGGRIRWVETTSERCEAIFLHPALSPEPGLRIVWTMEDAHKAGLPSINPNWHKYPRAQLRARVVTEGVRAVDPGVIVGISSDAEVDDFDPIPAHLDASPLPLPPIMRQATVIEAPRPQNENIVLETNDTSAYDARPYHALIVDETNLLNQWLQEITPDAKPIERAQIHRHIAKAAIEAGHAQPLPTGSKLGVAIELCQDVYIRQRDWVRRDLANYIGEILTKAQAEATGGQATAEEPPRTREPGEDG